MKLSFYATRPAAAAPQPASPTRQWMDESSQAFAYRCLPLNIANAHGWELLAPVAFSARWDGRAELGGIDIRSSGEPALQPTSVFGHGVLTFHVHGVFRTDPGWNLFATGPVNRPKDGIAALSGVIETDWAPYSFTMNWVFTRPNHWISFSEGEPFCFVFPVQRGVLDRVEPEIHDIADDPALKADLEAWSQERTRFSDRLNVTGSSEQRERWQKRYYRGLTMQDRPGAPDHQGKLRLAEFADRRKPVAPEPETPKPPELPLFFRKVVALSRIKHAKLGLRDGDFGFAASAHLVPLVAGEMIEAARHYPIVFTATNPPRPVCVLGAMPGINLHVDPAGQWRAGAYIPAAVRRYPFITIISKEDPNVLILGIDDTAKQLSSAAPAKLFERGEMTALCRAQLDLCSRIGNAFEQTDRFMALMPPDKMLMPLRNTAPARIASRSCMEGLRVIDPARLAALPEATQANWKEAGWLPALEAHIASGRHWGDLLDLDDALSRQPVPEPAAS